MGTRGKQSVSHGHKASAQARGPPAESKGRRFPSMAAGGLLAALLAAGAAWLLGLADRMPPEITPLKAPLMKQLPEFQDQAYRREMHWGSYRSSLYFGMRTRSERGLMTGVMWFDPQDRDRAPLSLRHEAQQGDGLAKYGWVAHDGRRYGRQELTDGDYELGITMVKAPDAPGSGFGGDWAVRVEASRRPADDAGAGGARQISVLFYVIDGRLAGGADMQAAPAGRGKRLGDGVVLAAGKDPEISEWQLQLLPAPGGGEKRARQARSRYASLPLASDDHVAQLRQVVRDLIVEGSQQDGWRHFVLPKDKSHPAPSMSIAQLTFNLSASEPAAFDFAFVTKGTGGPRGLERLRAITGNSLTSLIKKHQAKFDKKFDRVFPSSALAADGDAESGAPAASEADVRAASKAALSNLLGSMGYFHGASLVQLPPGRRAPPGSKQAPNGGGAVADYWAAPLFTCTPSRSFFPRGFLWDEGFHQLLVQKWDPQLSRDAMAHWLDLMNRQGWIPREQILGAEARARVPAEFVVQHPNHANPPSLYLPLLALARRAAPSGGGGGVDYAEEAAAREWLRRAWPRLEVWYGWFNRTQAGQLPGSYRWHGRDASTDLELNPKTLTSGLDDYPRSSHPTDDERHVDLLAWMALASGAMADIGSAIGAPAARVAKYRSAAAALGALPRVKALHYDEEKGMFLDWGLHTEAAALERTAVQQPDGTQQFVFRRVVREPPRRQLVPSFGYVSLFPLLMGLLPPDSPELGRQIAHLTDEDLLWTPHGLRSLAKNSSIYKQRNTEHDAPYWRGQIWININYLALRSLHRYSKTPGPHAAAAGDAYRRLRRALVGNLVTQYHSTGYLWEQYDDESGRGLSSHPFTGWTALLTLAVGEAY